MDSRFVCLNVSLVPSTQLVHFRTQGVVGTEADQGNEIHEAIPLMPSAVDTETHRVADTQEITSLTLNLLGAETPHATDTPGNPPNQENKGGSFNEMDPESLPDDPHVGELAKSARESIQILNRLRNETSYKNVLNVYHVLSNILYVADLITNSSTTWCPESHG